MFDVNRKQVFFSKNERGGRLNHIFSIVYVFHVNIERLFVRKHVISVNTPLIDIHFRLIVIIEYM